VPGRKSPLLIVFAGLPGTGKTTLARALADELSAVYLRIDTIEQAIRQARLAGDDVGATGYMIAYALARENLRQCDRVVVADAVNPIRLTRDAWREIATAASCPLIEIEVICSDQDEHRRRIETRPAEGAGLPRVTWQQVIDRDDDTWDRPHLVLDTATLRPPQALAEIRRWIAGTTK
jgi:predicted kinase